MASTKLTLNIDEAIIAETKQAAKEQQISLSKMVEKILETTIRKRKKPLYKTGNPKVDRLIGILPPLSKEDAKKPTKQLLREAYDTYLEEKY